MATQKKSSSPSLQIPQVAFEANRKVIDFQHNAVDRMYDTISGLQERGEDAWLRLLEGASFVPEEAKAMQQTWVELSRSGRQEWREAVSSSFDLWRQYTDRIESRVSK